MLERRDLSTSLRTLATAVLTLSAPASFAQEATTAAAADTDLAAVIEQGQTEYMKHCRACHGTNGTAGVPLAGNEKMAAPDYLIWAIITGPGYMPDFGPALSDEEIALISTFIVNSWGNSYGLVTAEDVAASR